jgi:hypothetical protein
MHTVILSSVSSPALSNFSTLSHKSFDFQKKIKILLFMKCVFWFSVLYLFETSLILRRIQRDTITNEHRSSCKVPFILDRFQWKLNFLNIFSKNTQVSNFMRICPVGVEFFHEKWQTDRRYEANSPFWQFCESSCKIIHAKGKIYVIWTLGWVQNFNPDE